MIGGKVRVSHRPVSGLVPVFLGSPSSNRELARAATPDALGVTDRYPAEGRYLLLEFEADGRPAVALYARDDKGLAKAVELWRGFLVVDHGLPRYDRVAFAESFSRGDLRAPPEEPKRE